MKRKVERQCNSLISIIVPVYNTAPFLRRCLNSIVNQTYKNIEIILVDDGSTDNSGTICDEYRKKDNRIRIIHKENGGVSSARNVGLAKATGDYIGFVDSDDWIELDMYEILISNIDNADISIIKEYDDRQLNSLKKQNYSSKEALLDLCISKLNLGASVWSKLVKKELFEGIKFAEDITIGEDLYMSALLYEKAKAIALVDYGAYHYCDNSNSAMHTFSEQDYSLQIVSEKLYATIGHLYPEEIDKAIYMYHCQDMFLAMKLARARKLNHARYENLVLHAQKYGKVNYTIIPFKKRKIVLYTFLHGRIVFTNLVKLIDIVRTTEN